MSNFNFEEWKQMQTMPFTYFTSKIIGAFKGLTFILFIIFFCLYLTDKIDWSLWYVTMPLWYGFPIIFLTLLIDFIRNLTKKKKKF